MEAPHRRVERSLERRYRARTPPGTPALQTAFEHAMTPHRRRPSGPQTGSFRISRFTPKRGKPRLVATGMIPVRAWCGCWGWREHSFTDADCELDRTQLFHLIDRCGGPIDADGFPRDVYIFGKVRSCTSVCVLTSCRVLNVQPTATHSTTCSRSMPRASRGSR